MHTKELPLLYQASTWHRKKKQSDEIQIGIYSGEEYGSWQALCYRIPCQKLGDLQAVNSVLHHAGDKRVWPEGVTSTP